MGLLDLCTATYDKTLYEVNFNVKGTLLIDGTSKKEIEEELKDYLKSGVKQKFLLGLINSVKDGDIEINEINEVF